MRIAIADDDPEVVKYLEGIVAELGHSSVCFANGDVTATALLRDTFDLLILDWMMPGRDGMELLSWMQNSVENPPPVLMMTNRTSKRDVTDALNAGAEDYITKPEDRDVIAARIKAILRRSPSAPGFDKIAVFGKYRFDRMAQTCAYNDQIVSLTAKEFDLADLLFRNRDRTLSRAYIMETVWRTSVDLTTRTLDMHVSRLRSKLALGPENGFRIFTVFGYGYRLESLATLGQ